jgi:hypothetical protein
MAQGFKAESPVKYIPICTKVNLIINAPDDWQLEFIGESFEFRLSEPDACSFKDWIALAERNHRLVLYQGNGEGSIESTDDLFIFTAAPSGSGGDVSLTISIKGDSVRPLLLEALTDALLHGLKFKV